MPTVGATGPVALTGNLRRKFFVLHKNPYFRIWPASRGTGAVKPPSETRSSGIRIIRAGNAKTEIEVPVAGIVREAVITAEGACTVAGP